MKKAERLEWLGDKAVKMAQSGDYTGWRDIETTLRNDGEDYACEALLSESTRLRLNHICNAAIAKKREEKQNET